MAIRRKMRLVRIRRKRLGGFTLMEMIIVVAIIATLVVIAIPTLTGMMEKSREATDLANVRSAYAEIMVAAISEDTASEYYEESTNHYIKKVALVQKINGWDISTNKLVIGGISSTDSAHWIGTPRKDGSCTVIYEVNNEEITIKWSGYVVEVGMQWSDSGNILKLVPYSKISPVWKASAVKDYISAEKGQNLVVKQITRKDFPSLYDNIKKGGWYEIGVYMCNDNYQCLSDTGAIKITGDEIKIELEPTKYTTYSYGASSENVIDMKLGISLFKLEKGKNSSVELTSAEAEELANLFEVE